MTSWTRIDTDTDLDSQSWDLGFEADWNDTTLTDEGTGTTQTRTHNAAHELLTIDPDGPAPGSVPAFSQGHDAKGNLTADGDGLLHTFDFDNMLRQVVVAAASPRGLPGVHTYAYDALGRRVSKSVDTDADNIPDETTVFVCAGNQVIAEYTPGNNASDPERKFIFCATGYIDEPIVMVDARGSGFLSRAFSFSNSFICLAINGASSGAPSRHTSSASGSTSAH